MSLSSGSGSGTALVLLAAGSSSRMGTPKQLLPWRGKPLILDAVETGLASFCKTVVVVVGANAAAVRSVLPDTVHIIENKDWELGMGSSIRVGVLAAQEFDADGLILSLADQPFISTDILNRLVEASQPIVASEYAGTVGVPVYFAREYFTDLLALKPAQGCKGLILAHPEALRIPCPEAELDIDTPEDFDRLKSTYPA